MKKEFHRLRKDLPQGLISVLRAKYLRGEYYLKREHITDVVAMILDYLDPQDSSIVSSKVTAVRSVESEISFIKDEIMRYESNQGFMVFKHYMKLKRRLQLLLKQYASKLDDLRRVIIDIFQDTDLMQKKVTMYQLKQLPLTADKSFDEPFGEEDDF
jgi:hypothetical protein